GIVFFLPLVLTALVSHSFLTGIASSGNVLIPSLLVGTIALAISLADSTEKRCVNTSITIGRFIPATMVHLSSCSLTKLEAWLKGVPPHKSTKNKTSS